MKCCTRCGGEKDPSAFYKNKHCKTGRETVCKACRTEQDRILRGVGGEGYAKRLAATQAYKKREDVKERNRAVSRMDSNRLKDRFGHIRRKFGLSPESYEYLLDVQNNSCLICNKEFTPETRITGPNIDHCHETQNIRGILCGTCNSGLGMFKDNIDVLKNAIKYLQENTQCLKVKHQL